MYSNAFQRSMTQMHVSLIHSQGNTALDPRISTTRPRLPPDLCKKKYSFQQPIADTEGEFVRSECGRSPGRVRERSERGRERRGRGKWAMRERDKAAQVVRSQPFPSYMLSQGYFSIPAPCPRLLHAPTSPGSMHPRPHHTRLILSTVTPRQTIKPKDWG